MHHDPSFRRRQMAIRFFTYGVMTLAVVVISIVCILFVLGYRFDQTSGRVEQRALLQLRTFPANANITLDGTLLGFRTPGKRTVSAGSHSISMQLDGYRKWQKDVTTEPGSLLWLNYARLIPDSVTTEEIQPLGALTSVKASPDRHWMAFTSVSPNGPRIMLGDISNEKQPKFTTVSLPAGTLKSKDGKYGSVTAAEWDFGGRFLLLKQQLAGKTYFIQMDRSDPTAARNITEQLKINISKAHFAGTSGSSLFVLSDGNIRKVDIASGTISRPFVSNVSEFMLYKSDLIAYVARDGEAQTVGMYKDGQAEPMVRRTFKSKTPAHVSVSSYYSDNYLAVAHGGEIEIIKNPENSSEAAGQAFAKFAFEPGVSWLDFSSNGRFVRAQNGNTLAVYDLELDSTSQMKIGNKPSGHKFSWLDDYYIVSDNDSTIRFTEFDGKNQQIITNAEPGFAITISENGEQLFSIDKNTAGEFVLQRSRLVLK